MKTSPLRLHGNRFPVTKLFLMKHIYGIMAKIYEIFNDSNRICRRVLTQNIFYACLGTILVRLFLTETAKVLHIKGFVNVSRNHGCYFTYLNVFLGSKGD